MGTNSDDSGCCGDSNAARIMEIKQKEEKKKKLMLTEFLLKCYSYNMA